MGSNGTPFSPVAEGYLRIADVVRWRVQLHGSGLDHKSITEPAWVGSRDRSFTRSYFIPGKNQFCLPPGTIPIAAEQQWDPTEIPFSPLAEDNLSCDIDGMGTESRSLFDPALPIAGAANFSLSHVASRNAPSPPLQIAQSYLSIGILYANCQPYVRNPE